MCLPCATASGLFTGDVEQYCAELEAALADGKTVRWVVETSDGRSMNILNRPIHTRRLTASKPSS
jgi:hypothetical protein